ISRQFSPCHAASLKSCLCRAVLFYQPVKWAQCRRHVSEGKTGPPLIFCDQLHGESPSAASLTDDGFSGIAAGLIICLAAPESKHCVYVFRQVPLLQQNCTRQSLRDFYPN
ncbi:MAG: hypothetical protein SPL25_12765, partial [Succinivibrionaceae bacterium]|nr:hypothetical protein [Succinivibrionaceae bacterium]